MTIYDVWSCCHKMLEDKWGYIWGASGQLWTQAKQDSTDNDMARKYGSQWIGHYVADCSGVMVYVWKQFGLSIYHGSNTIARKYVGQMSSTPQPGYAAFKWRSSGGPDERGDYYHIGIVDEDCKYVYESRSTKDGFRHDSPVSKWQFFAPFNQVEYRGGDEPMEPKYFAEVVTESGKLNIRSGPGTNYPIIGQLNKGVVVGVCEDFDNGWSYIQDHDDGHGYVSTKYLSPVETPEPAVEYRVMLRCASRDEATRLAEILKTATCVEVAD